MKFTKQGVIAALFFMIVAFTITVPISGQTAPARAEVVWTTGYDTFGERMNPWDGSPSWGCAFVYETLFGLNTAKDNTPIPVIGTEYHWAEDGSKLYVTLNPAAKWNTGDLVTAEDVIYSYELAANQSRYKGMHDDFSEIVKVDATHIYFNMTVGHYYSFILEYRLYTSIPIVPKSVWTAVTAAVGFSDFSDSAKVPNFWFNTSMSDAWKVASGPYEPYLFDLTAQEEMYKYREDWWGANVLFDDIPEYSGVPDAKYVAHRKISDNTAKDVAILTDQVDLHAGFYSSVWKALGSNLNIRTWFGRSFDEYYLALGSAIEVCFNHRIYPFNEIWFRQALAYAIDYDTIEVAASGGYWNRARMGIVDDRNPSHAAYYNASTEAKYRINLNFTKAIAILNAHCYQDDEGYWYTNDVPVASQDLLDTEDDDLVHAGINVKLGGYDMLVPAGWTDVVIWTQMVAADFTDLNITVSKREVDFWNYWRPKIMEMDYEIVMQCCGPALANDPYTVLGGWRSYTNLPWQNASGWQSPEFESIYVEFATATPARKDAIMDRMQELLASEIPTIPTHVNGFWYLTNTKYWKNWPGSENLYQDPTTDFTHHLMALKQRMLLGLQSVSGTTTTTPGISWVGFGIPIMIGIAAVLTVVIKKRRIV